MIKVLIVDDDERLVHLTVESLGAAVGKQLGRWAPRRH